MHKLEDLCDIKECLIQWAKEHKEDPCIDTYGQVIDMIKDLYEAEKDCYKAWYYAMAAKDIGDRSNDEESYAEGRMGYDHYRYSSGRFAPKGHGHYSAGYTPNRAGNMNTNNGSRQNMRAGMMPEEMRRDDIWEDRPYGYPRTQMTTKMTGRYGYPMDEQHGRAYNEFNDARRHYHESKDPTAKKEMDEHAMHHMQEVIMTSKDIYKDASPEMQKKLKSEFSKMVADLGTGN